MTRYRRLPGLSIWPTHRGVVLAMLVGLHALAIVGLMRFSLVQRPVPEAQQAVELALIRESAQVAPPDPVARLQPVELQAPALPEVDVPRVEAPAAEAAITVAQAERPAVAVEAPREAVDAPISVDEVEYLSRVPPRYPVAARRARAEGTVYLRVFIDPDGLPREVRVQRSCGFRVLDDAAIDAARRFRFKPHRVNGIARNVQAIVPIEFTLTERATHNPRNY